MGDPADKVNPAFGLVRPTPTPRARVFARAHRAGAGLAADRGVAARNQRMAWQRVPVQIGGDFCRAPACKRVQPNAPSVRLTLDRGKAGAGIGLKALCAR